MGVSVLIRGMGLNTLSVPLHRVNIKSDLVQEEVVLGVRPALPVEGEQVILGNGLAGERVWDCFFLSNCFFTSEPCYHCTGGLRLEKQMLCVW